MHRFWNAKSLFAVPVVVAAVALTGCSSGHSSSTPPGGSGSASATGPVESVATFCGQVSTVESDISSVTSITSLASAKTSFAKVTADTKAITNPPAAIRSDALALVSDIQQINTWLDTQATQSDLNGNSAPPAIAGPFNDLNTRGTAVDTWAKAHCK